MTLCARLEFAHVILIFVDGILIVIICVDHESALFLISVSLLLLLFTNSILFNLSLDVFLPVLHLRLLCRSELPINQGTILIHLLRSLGHRFLELGLRVCKIDLYCLYWLGGQGSTLRLFVQLNHIFVDTVRAYPMWQGFSRLSNLELEISCQLLLFNLWI